LENVVSLILSTSNTNSTAMHSLAFMSPIFIKIKNSQLENTKIINRKYSKNPKFDSKKKKITLTELIFKITKTTIKNMKSIHRLIIKNYLFLFSIISNGIIFLIMAKNGLILFNKIKLI
jgi:hypothetical protein